MSVLDRCRGCERFGAVNESGLCKRCARLVKKHGIKILFKESTSDRGKVIGFSLGDIGLIPIMPSGLIYPRDEWEIISRLVNQFYRSVSDKELNEYNISKSTRYKVPGDSPPIVGYIYLLMSENGYYKIGRTTNIQKRLKAIQREYPIEIKLLHFWECDNYIEVESTLHELYKEYRRGKTEWFSLPQDIVNDICDMS